jgi:hypothetical protein
MSFAPAPAPMMTMSAASILASWRSGCSVPCAHGERLAAGAGAGQRPGVGQEANNRWLASGVVAGMPSPLDTGLSDPASRRSASGGAVPLRACSRHSLYWANTATPLKEADLVPSHVRLAGHVPGPR